MPTSRTNQVVSRDWTPRRLGIFGKKSCGRYVIVLGKVHAFTDQAATDKGKTHKMPLEYNEKADQQSWAEMTRFFEELFPPE